MRSSLRAALGAAAATGGLVFGATAAAAHTYEVQPGDTLADIAVEVDEVSSWRELFELNADTVADPNLILVGQVLQTTASSAAATPAAPAAEPAPAATSAPADGSVWDRLAQCESGGNWSTNTGNGYYGGLQFTLDSWQWVGGSGYPHEASRDEQIARAETLQARQGWDAWPACADQLGLR